MLELELFRLELLATLRALADPDAAFALAAVFFFGFGASPSSLTSVSTRSIGVFIFSSSLETGVSVKLGFHFWWPFLLLYLEQLHAQNFNLAIVSSLEWD